MRISGVDGYVDIDATEDGYVQVSVRHVEQNVDSLTAVRLTGIGAAAVSSTLDAGALELEARDEAAKGVAR